MTKVLMLASVLLLLTAWLQAQNPPPAGNPSDHPTSAHASTVQGCLQGSAGNFTVTDNSGTTYVIQGDTSTMGEHVGHEVRITGTTSSPSSDADKSTSSETQPIIQLQNLQHVSKTCKSAKAKD